ncbi:uncharacterized protein LOC133190887 [Saccostrea echinata]|uniref:uncharacterized protein LOC133190887 n=1 Tax=Saccostrea echinata TaxID=191078 RepID=UPI002A824EB7|nr:uncharacterized protein LOC133190887 [Saccostrea echinata]
MDRIPTIKEINALLQDTKSKTRLKNAALVGTIDFLSAGFEIQANDLKSKCVQGVIVRISGLENELSAYELTLKNYISSIRVPKRFPKGSPHTPSKTDSGIDVGQDLETVDIPNSTF